tara:strand:+ start:1 stop:1074 length:1074 start_codon:yes stop_codon:yes gene_type:complete
MKFSRFKPVKRIRKSSPNPLKYLRLHRAEFGHEFKKRINKKNVKNFYYPDVTSLKKKLSIFHSLPYNFINLGSGAESLIKDVFIWHSKKYNARNVGFGVPIYNMYSIYAKIFDYKKFNFYYDPEQSHFLNYEYIINFVKKNKISLLVMVNPSHPFEKNWTQNDLKKIISFCKKKNVIVLLDEVYQGEKKLSASVLTKKYNNLIILRSFSKAFGLPAIRVGYTLACVKLNNFIETFRLSTEIPQSSIDKGLDILTNYDSEAKKRFRKIDKARKLARAEFEKRGLQSYNDNVNSVSANLIKKKNAKFIGESLKKNKIFINYNYPKNLNKYINLTTTHTSNVKFFFKKFDMIAKKLFLKI